MTSIEEVKHLQIPFQELSDATNAFSKQNLIASGGFGKVYRGVSVKHGNIAIKKLDPRLGQGDKEFRTEIALLSVYKHENIVSLLGFCDEDQEKILVYKYESNGSLDRHLNNANLTWIQRLRICIDAARGLQYLHDDVGSQHRVLHRDVKSSNILLDENWKAKISDFGLSRVGPANIQSTVLMSNPCGTYGYIDPEYASTRYLTQKSDVYSFGIVLFEILCGRLTRLVEYKDEREFLINLVRIHWGNNTLNEIIFPDLLKPQNLDSLVPVSRIAYQCLMSSNERPTMKKVVEKLQKALYDQLAASGSYDGDFAAHLGGQSGLMASSSQSSPVSSSKSWNYDLFISFRGEDTRRTFVDYLYTTLVHKGIFTVYKDDETLALGESISQSLSKTIQESRIAIIVFSQNYASSSWCLDELAFIMKNRHERGQIVLPIFYDVNPSEVRFQRGRYGEALAQHELHNRKVESWRKALAEAANLSGWELPSGLEPEFMLRICDDILNILLNLMPRSEPSHEASANTNLIGVETRMQELKSLLKVWSDGVHMVGICGMWGSGKSTLASSIYDEISFEFEGCCFVRNVRDRSRVHGLKTLHEEILSNVLKLKVTLTDINQGIYTMKRRLSQHSVLIILDDVDHIDHLKMLAGSKNWFGKGSRIIFTTRNQDLVDAHNSIIHNVRMLDDMEAIELFSRHAFGKSKPVQGFKEVSVHMVSKFGGHPSTLISIGSYLHGKDMSEWMSILDRLVDRPVDEVLRKFETPDDGIVRNIFAQFFT